MADQIDALETFVHGILADHLNTHLEATIVAYANGRVDVQPIGKKNYSDGDSLDYPVLKGLKLCWLAGDGGLCGFKPPVKVGDKCTVLFDQHPQDTEGNDPDQVRRFSLADARVLPGTAYSDDLPGNDNLSMYYGKASVQITPSGQVKIIAPGGFVVESPSINFSQTGGGVTTTSFKGRVTMDNATIATKDFLTHFHVNSGGSGNGGAVG